MSSLVTEQAAFLQDYMKLIAKATELGFVVTSGELLRPVEMQQLYVASGRSKTMNSYHIRKLAGDLNFFLPDTTGKLVYICEKEALQELGDYWESLNSKNSWGGNWRSFKDAPHFERRA